MALIYGILAWPLVAAFVGRAARRAPTRGGWLGWGAAGARRSSARCSRSSDLAGRGGARRARAGRRARRGRSRRLGAAAAVPVAADRRRRWRCVLIPELVYLRDAFDGSAADRMNTVFKLGYQALAAARRSPPRCALPWAGAWLPRRRRGRPGRRSPRSLLLLGARLPVRGHATRATAASRNAPTLDGLGWLRERAHPATRARSTGCARTRPATRSCSRRVGDDYSAFGHGAHLDVHRPPDRDRLGRPRAAVGARPGHARGATSRRSTRRPTPPTARRADRPLRHRATSSSARSSAPTTATPGSRSGTSSAARVLDSRRHDRVGAQAPLRARRGHVQPLRHPARRVPALALREPARSRAAGSSIAP